jgi:hypothetical protein
MSVGTLAPTLPPRGTFVRNIRKGRRNRMVPLTPEEVRELGEWSRKIVEVYMQWYTFFVTANLLIMGWFHSKEIKSNTPLVPVARLFQFCNLLGAVSTGMVGYYVSNNIPAYARLIRWAAISNGLALLGTAFVWGLVIPKSKK